MRLDRVVPLLSWCKAGYRALVGFNLFCLVGQLVSPRSTFGKTCDIVTTLLFFPVVVGMWLIIGHAIARKRNM